MKKFLPLIMLIIVAMSSCRKNISESDIEIIKEPVKVLIESSMKGLIVNEAGEPMANVNISIGDYATVTNYKGQYEFRNIELEKDQVLIRAEKDGFFIGSSNAKMQSNAIAYPKMTILDKGEPVVFDMSLGGEVEFEGGTKLVLPKNALKTSTGTIYTGQVNIFSRTISPDDDQFLTAVPGRLEGKAEDGTLKSLAGINMVRLEFEAENGDELEINDDADTEILIPIPDALLGAAPDELPLWVFDMNLGRWINRDLCSRRGKHYSGQIYPGTIMPCKQYDLINFETNIFHQDSTPGSYLILDLDARKVAFKERWYSDSEGNFKTTIPKDFVLDYTITDICHNVLYESAIGEFSDDVVLPNIFLDSIVNTYTFVISGRLLDCNSNPIDSGQVQLSFENHFRNFKVGLDGSFAQEVSFNCSYFPEILVTGYNKDTTLRIEQMIELGADIDLGDLIACDAKEDFINFTYDGKIYEEIPCRFRWGSTSGNFDERSKIIISRSYNGSVGLHIRNSYSFQNNQPKPAVFWSFGTNPDSSLPNLDVQDFDVLVEITEENDNFISGSFSGLVIEKGKNGSFPITGSFKARK